MSSMTIDARPKGLLAHLREGRGAAPWRGRRWLALVLLVVVPLVAMAGLFTASAANATGGEKDENKFSMYAVGSSTTSFFNRLMSPDDPMTLSDTGGADWKQVTGRAASGGSLLGWADPDFSISYEYAAAQLSGTSSAQTYSSLQSATREVGYGPLYYANFGAALNGLGLDSMGTGLSLGFFETIGGGIVYGLFMLVSGVDVLFSGFVSLLALLNPFKLLYNGVSNWNNTEFADGMVGGNPDRKLVDDRLPEAIAPGSGESIGAFFTNAFSGLADFVSEIYGLVSGLAWGVMVPLFIAIFFFSILAFKKSQGVGGKIKKLLIRIGFIGLGVPLLGMMYTGTVDSLAEASKGGNMGATQVVASTFVDFESWAMNERLRVPSGATIEWNKEIGAPTAESTMNIRDTVFAINQASVPGLEDLTKFVGGDFDLGWSTEAMKTNTETKDTAFEAIRGMLDRYMAGTKVESADFASGVTTSVTGLTLSDRAQEESDKTKVDWFESLQDKNILEPKGSDGSVIPPSTNPVISVAPETGLSVSVRGGTDGLDESAVIRAFSSVGVANNCGTKIASSSGAPLNCNLAPQAMYNFLNTSFGPESFTTYSSAKAMSSATRESHNAVNIAGTGAMSTLYWLNAVVLLASFAVIGLGYGIALVVGNIRRGIQAISAIPFATLGALAAIGKVIVYTFAMVLELVVTLFLYKFVQELLLIVPSIVEMPFSLFLNGDDTTAADVGFVSFLRAGGGITFLITLVTIVFVIAFTVMAMRIRKTVIKAIEEAITKLVEKLTDASVGGAPGGKMAPALAGGLAAGAGAAAANRMMSGGSKAPGALAAGAPGSGPDGTGTAGGATGGTDGGDSSTTVGGEIETGNGTLAVEGGDSPAPGNGDPGSPLALTSGPGGVDSAAAETAEGKRVEAEGLTPDGGAPAAGGTDGGYAVDANGDAVPAKDVQTGESAIDGVSESMDQSAEGYKAADKQRLAAGTEGAQAAGHGALAVGRAYTGDAAGAAESAGRAVEHGGNTVAAGERAKQAEQDAGRSSLDKPSTKHADRAQKAQQVSQVGGTVANAAGAASSTGGAGKVVNKSKKKIAPPKSGKGGQGKRK